MTKDARPTCQHCDQPVHWGRTEQGFAGFVHDETERAECPATKENNERG